MDLKKITAIMLAALMAFGTIGFADADGNIISENGSYTVTGSQTVTVKEGVSAEIALDNATLVGVGTSGLTLEAGASVTLILNGTNTISGDAAAVSAGIYVPAGANLTIKGDGVLDVTGGKYGAGIGSVKDVVSGDIVIESGTVNATGGDRGAGIGSGYHASAGSVTIQGGAVTAIGTGCGAGIGTGYGTSGGGEGKVGLYSGGDITINGGVVRAAAFPVDFSVIDPMNPDSLKAYDKNTFAAGIGGGYGSSSGTVKINGGSVFAIGSCGGAGIGSGRGTSKLANYDPDAFFTDISIGGDAVVTAMATDDTRNKKGGGAAIGTGRGTHTGGRIQITGNASVTAIASPFSAAIGAGSNNSPVDGAVPVAEDIVITDGVSLYAVSDGTHYAIDTAQGAKTFDGISAKVQQVLFDDAVLAQSRAYVWTFGDAAEKTIMVPAGMRSVATDVANVGTYYLKSGELFGQQTSESVEYANSGTLGEHTCSALIAWNNEPVLPPEEEIIAGDPIPLSNDYAYIFGRNDSSMAPDEEILRGEACAVLYRLLKQNDATGDYSFNSGNAPVFTDLADSWDRSAVEYMAYLGIYDPAETPLIRSLQPIPRKEAFKLFAVALGFTKQTTLTYGQYASILLDRGYIQGDGSGDLKLNDTITRAEYCTIYNNIIGRDNASLTDASGNPVTAQTYGFVDLDPSQWFYEIMLKATSAYTDGYVDLDKRADRNAIDDYE